MSKAMESAKSAKSPHAVLFSIPGTKAFCASGALARLPMSMMGLGIILALNHLYDNCWRDERGLRIRHRGRDAVLCAPV